MPINQQDNITTPDILPMKILGSTATILKTLSKGIPNACIVLDAKTAQTGIRLQEISSSPIEQNSIAIKTNLDRLGQTKTTIPLQTSFKQQSDPLDKTVAELKMEEEGLTQQYKKLVEEQKKLMTPYREGKKSIQELLQSLKPFKKNIDDFTTKLITHSKKQEEIEQNQSKLLNASSRALPPTEQPAKPTPLTPHL